MTVTREAEGVGFEPESRDLVAELFPVEVTLPDNRVVLRAKVFVLKGGILVYGEEDTPQGRKPFRAFQGRHAEDPVIANPALPKRHQMSVFQTSGGEVRANGILGCGCSSSLKNLRVHDVVVD